uniref:prepilin peptidase n=1 Tax=Comamonas sp. TaxID=34028 RepID=UPI003A907C09
IYVTLIPELHLVNIDIKDSVFGGFLAFVVLLIFYALGMLGAGDVKFAAALGFWIGWKLLLPVWALSCAFAVAHGLFVRSNLRYFFVKWIPINSETQFKNKRFIPYVTYLSLATIIVLMLYK